MDLTAFRKNSKSSRPHYLLFGHPVEHSWSPLMHNAAIKHYDMNARYHAVNLKSNELTDLSSYLNRESFLGANITIPYKQQIIPYLDEVRHPSDKIGAVNTIVKKDYRIEGHNTDCDGFLAPLEEFEEELMGFNAVVFGTGGASKAIVVALRKLGVEMIYLVSRMPARISSFNNFDQVEIISYDEWTSLTDEVLLIVNATPLGMHPDVEKSPVRDSEIRFLRDRICYDIVYNPIKTKFLQQADEAGATTINGLEMLIQQASRSFELWTGHSFPIEIIRSTLHERFKD